MVSKNKFLFRNVPCNVLVKIKNEGSLLSEFTNITNYSYLGVIVKHMKRSNLLIKRKYEDSRCSEIILTPKGKELQKRVKECYKLLEVENE